MFPFNDFNVVYCALATVSAAVGYGYTRRRLPNPPRLSRSFNFALYSRKTRSGSTSSDASCTTPTSADSEASEYGSVSTDYPTPVSIIDTTEPDSLKRKHRDEEDTDNSTDGDSTPHPRKRHRSSSPAAEEQLELAVSKPESHDMDVVPEPQPVEESIVPVTEAVAVISENPPAVASPSPALSGAAYSIPAYKPSDAFAAFAGSSSPFSLAANPTGGLRPAWCSITPVAIPDQTVVSHEAEKSVVEEASPETTDSEKSAATFIVPPASETMDDPLAALSHTPSTQTVTSGEEDEDTKAELRGVKLFIKRGKKEFSTGMLGHIKHLCDMNTGEERLVFRREPVWKVSMSVRLKPSIRCSFDKEQGVLRMALMELDEESGEQHLVIYALKRGKLPKQDFANFVEDILASTQLSGKPMTAPLDGAMDTQGA